MSGKADEIDIVMAIENIGNELKKIRETRDRELRPVLNLLEDIAGSLELMVLAFQGVYK
jgi:hypothetical protein